MLTANVLITTSQADIDMLNIVKSTKACFHPKLQQSP